MDKQKQLPPESVRTLKYINAEVSAVLSRAETDPFLGAASSVKPTRAAVTDFWLQAQTQHLAQQLRTFFRPFTKGTQFN